MFAAMSSAFSSQKVELAESVTDPTVESKTETACVNMMQMKFPEVPRAELLRFYRATNDLKKATAMYEAHVAYKAAHPEEERVAAHQKIPDNFIRPCPGKAIDGTPIMMVQGARYATTATPEDYVLGVMDELERATSGDELTKWTIMLDVRCQEGWANEAATEMFPFFKACNRLVSEHYPERIHRVMIYPVPAAVTRLWWVVKKFLDPATVKKVTLISGPSEEGGPCPMKLGEYITLDALPEDVQEIHKELRAMKTMERDSRSEAAVALEA